MMAAPAKTQRASSILLLVEDLVSDFMYYDRKEDEELPRGAIEDAVANGELTAEDIVDAFREALERGLS